ncbi:unnamed protein product, partial [Rangifer tarandus platyrhynchus]
MPSGPMPTLHLQSRPHWELKDPTQVGPRDAQDRRQPGVRLDCTRLRENPSRRLPASALCGLAFAPPPP